MHRKNTLISSFRVISGHHRWSHWNRLGSFEVTSGLLFRRFARWGHSNLGIWFQPLKADFANWSSQRTITIMPDSLISSCTSSRISSPNTRRNLEFPAGWVYDTVYPSTVFLYRKYGRKTCVLISTLKSWTFNRWFFSFVKTQFEYFE